MGTTVPWVPSCARRYLCVNGGTCVCKLASIGTCGRDCAAGTVGVVGAVGGDGHQYLTEKVPICENWRRKYWRVTYISDVSR